MSCLSLLGAPVLETSLSPVSLLMGETATFSCVAKGVPRPSIQWTRDGEPIDGGDEVGKRWSKWLSRIIEISCLICCVGHCYFKLGNFNIPISYRMAITQLGSKAAVKAAVDELTAVRGAFESSEYSVAQNKTFRIVLQIWKATPWLAAGQEILVDYHERYTHTRTHLHRCTCIFESRAIFCCHSVPCPSVPPVPLLNWTKPFKS